MQKNKSKSKKKRITVDEFIEKYSTQNAEQDPDAERIYSICLEVIKEKERNSN